MPVAERQQETELDFSPSKDGPRSGAVHELLTAIR
jgi:hypothetical protein